MAGPNYYVNYPIHPHQRFHGPPGGNAYSRNNSMSWHNNKVGSGNVRQLKNVRMVEPNTILSDYRSGAAPAPHKMNFAPVYPTQKYDGRAMLERTQKRIQAAHRKRGNLVEGKIRAVAKEPTRRQVINLDRPKIVKNTVPISKPTEPIAPKTINLDLAVKATKPPSVRQGDTKPQPNANNDWSTNYNDDFRNWTRFKSNLKNKTTDEFVTAGQTATHHLNAEKRKYMEKLRREQEERSARALSEKKRKQQEDIENRRQNTQKVLEELKKEQNETNNTENKENGGSKTAQRFGGDANSKFQSETTNTSTFKRWPKSAFQTCESRNSEKPVWAMPSGSQHFPVNQPRQKVLKDSTKHNMNITLTIDGKSMGSKSVPKVGTGVRKQQRNKSKFQSEYQSKYVPPVSIKSLSVK